MKKALLKERKPLLVILAVYIITFILTYGCQGNLIVDCGREAYIPFAISQNKLLYKEIFCIYGAFPYFFMAFFFKLFSPNLNILYLLGGIFGLLYTYGVYFCSREFLSKALSICICMLIIYSVIFGGSIFNFIFPYSYAIVISSTCAIWILFLLLKYIHTKKTDLLYYCSFLWGIISVSKIEFIPTAILVLAIFLLYENEKKLKFIKLILFSSIVPALTLLILLTQGVSFSDVMQNAKHINEMIHTKSFKYFYENLSVLSFSTKNFLINLKGLLSTAFISLIFFYISLFAIRKRRKFLKYSLLVAMVIFCYSLIYLQETMPEMIFATLPYIYAVAFLVYLYKYLKIKEYKNPNKIKILVLLIFTLVCSLKSFHALLLSFYGSYCFAPYIICLAIFIKEFLRNNALYNTKGQYETILSVYLLIITLIFANELIISSYERNSIVKTSYGTIKTTEKIAQPFNETLQYLNTHSKQGDSLLVIPEGIMLNFLSGKTNDFYQTSLIPLDFDTFKEDNIINEIKVKKPEFIAFTNRETDEYGQGYICKDYGMNTCKYVAHNYSLEAAFGEKFRIYLFKNKELENEKE